jgi:hypothetical protein
VSATEDPASRFQAPPRQRNLDRATELAFEALQQQSPEQLAWLGVETTDKDLQVQVLDDRIGVSLAKKRVTTSAGQDIGPFWRILVLHYLKIAGRPEQKDPAVVFADLANARSYNKVYEGRTVGRLCGTIGREEGPLREAALGLGGHDAEGGDMAFDFDLFPRLSMRLVWHAPDEEFPPSATILFPPNIESFFCSEDITVLSERLVSRLCGRPF